MRRSTRKEKVTYILAGAAFVLVALVLLALLVLRPAHKEKEQTDEPAATAETVSPTPVPDGIVIAGKFTDKATDSFDLSGMTLTEEDRAAIATLKNLTTLSLTKCSLSDLSFLQSLTAITTLYLPDNQITDLSPLAGMQSLRTLYLDNNPLADLSPLGSLTSLTTLSIQGVTVADYVLEDLQKQIPQCHIFNNSTVETARPISLGGVAFTDDVTVLDLSNHGISDIGKLSYCLQLQDLDLSGNPVEDYAVLAGLPKLERLKLTSVNLTDEALQQLKALRHLTWLNIEGNGALTREAVDALSEALAPCEIVCENIPYVVEIAGTRFTSDRDTLELSNRGINSLNGLEKFDKLRILALEGNAVADLSPLREVYTLEELDASHNAVADISMLTNHIALRKLDLSHNAVIDIYSLASCTSLEELDLSYNNINYISHLSGCTSLRRLNLTANPDLTAEQLLRLQETLPLCEIITDVSLETPMPEPEYTPVPVETPAPEFTPVPVG